MKKITLYFIFVILVSFLVVSTSIKECQRTMITKDIPCIQPTSWLPPNPCNTYNYSIINQQNASIENGTFYSAPTSCQFVFTYNSPNIYFWNSSIDSGVITVERENDMIAIILSFILVISYFAVLGAINKAVSLRFLCFALSIIELILMVAIVYVSEGMGDYMPLLYVNFYSILILGFGFGIATLFIKSADSMNLNAEEGESILQLEEEKWVGKKWE